MQKILSSRIFKFFQFKLSWPASIYMSLQKPSETSFFSGLKAFHMFTFSAFFLLGILIFTLPETGFASLNACSFYTNENLTPNFWSCAAPKIKRNDCTLIKGVCPLCVKYQGDKGQMYMPDFFVEVTTEFGKSQFDGNPLLKEHLKLAKNEYGQVQGAGALKMLGVTDEIIDRLNDGGPSPEGNSHFWHVRILQPPFGTTAFTYFDMPLTGVATAVAPTCFQGISELLKDQWNYNLADMPFAGALAPFGLKMCSDSKATISAELASKAFDEISSLDIFSGLNPPGLPLINCAIPLPASLMMALNFRPGSDAMSLKKLCMRDLGNLIPRQGTQDTEDPFISAVQAAWKFLSLVSDVHPHTGVSIDFKDKWQLVYPPSTSYFAKCFKPGGFEGHWPTLGPVELKGLGSSSYIFAIWRPRKTMICYEPGTIDTLWKKRIKYVDHKLFETACKAMEAI